MADTIDDPNSNTTDTNPIEGGGLNEDTASAQADGGTAVVDGGSEIIVEGGGDVASADGGSDATATDGGSDATATDGGGDQISDADLGGVQSSGSDDSSDFSSDATGLVDSGTVEGDQTVPGDDV